MTRDPSALTPREATFVREYLVLHNQTKAYIAAGYAEKGAAQNAHRLMMKDKVKAAVALGEEKLRAALQPTVDRIVTNLARMAFSGMSKFVRINDEGDPQIDLSACTPDDLDLLSEITTESWLEGEGESSRMVRKVKIKPYDRYQALVKMGQHLGMFKGTAGDAIDALGALLKEIQERGSAIPVKPQGPLGSLATPWKGKPH